jgi:hypothetical protein
MSRVFRVAARRFLVAVALVATAALGFLKGQDATVSAPAPSSPSTSHEGADAFYRKYLVYGNPLDDEIDAMEKRIQASPNDANLHNDFGNLLVLRRFPEQAEEQYELAAKLDKHNFVAYYNLGLLRETLSDMSGAISAYEKSIKRKPGFPPSRFRLGRLFETTGRLDDAVSQYAKALWIDPSMRDPKRNPLVIDSDLMYRASLSNYERDMARATLDRDLSFHEEPAFHRVPVDRSLSSADIKETRDDELEPAPREVGPGTGQPASPGTTGRRPRVTPPADAPMLPRPRPTGPRTPRGQRVAPPPAAPTPAPQAPEPEVTPAPEEPELPPGFVPQPQPGMGNEPTPAPPPEDEVEPS